MNWVEKYVEDILSELENSTVEKNVLFFNGVNVRSNGSDIGLLIYQVPLSDVVVEVVYENRVELYTNRIMYNERNKEWIVLSTVEKVHDDR